VVSAAQKEPLPASLAAASRGRFQSSLPSFAEGRRDFARIFLPGRQIFIWTPDMPNIRPLKPSAGPSSAHIGDLNELAVAKAEELFRDSLTAQLTQACGGSAPPAKLVDLLSRRAMRAMTVNVGIDFATKMDLLPTFLQPFFLIIVLSDLSEARAATYGFVAANTKQIVGDRPESKRTPFCVRLLSPDLLSASEDSIDWEVEYSVRELRKVQTILQAVEMDMPKVRDAMRKGRWEDT